MAVAKPCLGFTSCSNSLTPLKRDFRLGRHLDGNGSYAEDRIHGVRVIDLSERWQTFLAPICAGQT